MRIGIGLLVIVTISSIAANIILFNKVQKLGSTNQPSGKDETAQLVEKIGLLINLPDEQPTVATVTDPEKLQDQPFFLHAKKGDKVLVFSVAKKAILYDPVANKIIETAPISSNSADVAPSGTSSKKIETSSKKPAK